MHFKVEQEIFEKLPNACFGVVVAKGIDNTKDYPQIYDWLEEARIAGKTAAICC